MVHSRFMTDCQWNNTQKILSFCLLRVLEWAAQSTSKRADAMAPEEAGSSAAAEGGTNQHRSAGQF